MERPCGDDDEDDGPDGAGGGCLNHDDGEDDGGSSDGLLDDASILQRQRQQQSGVARQLCTTLLLNMDGTRVLGQGESVIGTWDLLTSDLIGGYYWLLAVSESPPSPSLYLILLVASIEVV